MVLRIGEYISNSDAMLVSILYIYHEHKCDILMVVIVGVIFKWCKTMVRNKTEFLAIGVTFRQALVIWCVVTKSWVTLFLIHSYR